MKKFKIKSFCKINLSLRVFKRKTAKYHPIRSFITFCNIYDVIDICKIQGFKDKINFSGKFKNNISTQTNTITKVLAQLRKIGFFKKQAFRINIKKNIPHGSGLGGGSSNAAALLNFFNNKMKLRLGKKKINKIARKIGFDVPVILEKRNTLLTGKKDEIIRFNKKLNLNILIVYPNLACSTKKIYEKNRKFSNSSDKLRINLNTNKKLIYYLINEKNDLEPAVVNKYPKVGKLVNILKIQKGCYFSRITGSGSACIGIFSDVESAILSQKLIKSKFPNYWSVVSKSI